MTEKETGILIAAMKANWGSQFEKKTPQDIVEMIKAWQFVAADEPYEKMQNGLKICMRSGMAFYPTVGQVIEAAEKAEKLVSAPQMNALEAWGLVRNALGNSIYNYEEEFKKLPELVKKVIRVPKNLKAMAMMPIQTVESVEQSHFIREFDVVLKRENEIAAMPPELKKVTAEIVKRLEGNNG